MAWDETLPNGDLSIAQGDNDIRANNTALEAALTVEHEFSTGGTNGGRHMFPLDTSANLALLSNLNSGGLALDQTIRAAAVTGDGVSLVYYDGADWQFVDVGTAVVARTDEEQDWTSPQNTEWVAVTPVGGSPDTMAVDMDLSPCKYATISGDTIVSNATNLPAANHCQMVVLQLTMSGAGNVITWGTNYRSSNGVAPFYDDSDGAINYFYLTRMQTGVVLVSSAPNVGTF